MKQSIADINTFLQQYFDKILVISIERFKDRHEKINRRMQGIAFDFLWGVDKNTLDEDFIQKNYVYLDNNFMAVRHRFPPMNKGEIACALSHLKAYSIMLENDWKHILIFEDDIVPNNQHLHLFKNTIEELPTDWDVCYFGYTKNTKATWPKKMKQFWYRIMCFFGASRMPAAMVKRTLPLPYGKYIAKAGFHDCTHAYAISAKAARKMLALQTPIHYRADNAPAYLIMNGELNAFISRTIFFDQEKFQDENIESSVQENKK